MASKRALEKSDQPPDKRQRKGFTVGPDNLPDGTHRRKVQKIKRDLIDKAKLKNEYAKVKARMLQDEQNMFTTTPSYLVRSSASPAPSPSPQRASPTLEPHPDRIANLTAARSPSPPAYPTPKSFTDRREDRREKTRVHKANRKQNAVQKAESEAAQKRNTREEAARERESKIAARERLRRRIAKARRPGKDGKRKLGRESGVLLERIKKIVERGQSRGWKS